MRMKNLYSDLFLFIFFIFILIGYSVYPELIYVGYAVLCIFAFLGPTQAIQALSINYIFLMLSPAVYSVPIEELRLMRWVVLFIAILRIMPLFSVMMLRKLVPLLVFFIVVTALSLFSSPSFAISFLKVTVFAFFVATVLTAFDSFDEESLMELKIWFFSLAAVVVVFSLPTLFMPKVGFFLNGRGFQGIFNHPQAFGIFLVPPAAYLVSCLLFKKELISARLWLPIVFTVMFIFLSGARTAMLALFFSLAATWVFAMTPSRKVMFGLKPLQSFVKIGVVAGLLLSLIVASSAFSETVAKFWIKGGKESFYSTRGKATIYQWSQFLEHPFTGNGFGIDIGHDNIKNKGTLFSIPIAAPSEKGFLPVALLEETGIVGFISFAVFFLFLFRGVFNVKNVGLIGVFFACIAVNIGEDVFFSPGYIGGFMWLLIGLSTARGWQSGS